MDKLTTTIGVCTIFTVAFGLIAASVFGYDPAVATYTWAPGVPNYNPSVVLHPGTIDTSQLVMGDFLGISSIQPNAPGYGDSGSIVGWDDSWVYWVGDGNTNGDNLDGKWVHIIYPVEGWWDLGFETNKVVVFLSQDHGPYLGEGLETRVYGSNTLWGSVSSQAVLTEVYLDGWRPHNPAEDRNRNGWTSDDIVGVYELPGNYRYIKITAWSRWPDYNEPEVDAVATFPKVIEAPVDIKPQSCPNPLNVKARGVLPVAILGTADFDVTKIDPDSIKLEGVSPLRSALEDVATPYEPFLGKKEATDCTDEGADGYLDLTLKFDQQAIVEALGDVNDGEVRVLRLSGNLKPEFGGTPIIGEDVVVVLKKINGNDGNLIKPASR
jgi:hypothetical protein